LERGEGEIGEEDAGLNRRRGELETARISAGLREGVTPAVSSEGEGGVTGEEGPDRVGPPVSGVRKESGYRFGIGFLGRGLDSRLGRKASPRPFYLFFFLSPFSFSISFLFSYLLRNFCKTPSNQTKPFS
jgi:hypothetical protein